MAIKHFVAVAGFCLTTALIPRPALAQTEEITVRACTVQSLGVFPNRVHILCNHNAPSIGLGALADKGPTIVAPPYFALDTGPVGTAAIAVASAAMARGRTLTITYKNAASQNPVGCQANDCRRLVAVMIN